ncbi:MAG: hypothetical protein ACAI43_21440 [Phycisphaerae bacterium]|nr:hypothetical protein [Tepidisphaeraceae bacterium]
MHALVEQVRSLKVVVVVLFVCTTVWVAGWERNLRQRVENGVILPAPTKQEIADLKRQRVQAELAARASAYDGE